MSRGPWQPPAWFEWPAQRIRFERELAACGVDPRRTRPERRHRGGYQLTVTLVPPGLAPRQVTIVFTRTTPMVPCVYADGPTDSPHRYDDGALCMWYPFDPAAARWTRPGGAAALLGQIVAHLVREEWWRRTGEWVGDEAAMRSVHLGKTPELTPSSAASTVGGSPAAAGERVPTHEHRPPAAKLALVPPTTTNPQARSFRRSRITCGSAVSVGGTAFSAAVLAALITATINLWLARRRSREEERSRIRTTLAEAFQAYAAYREFPYAVRRRRHDQPAEERIRLSEALREVQTRLTYFEAWTKTEDPRIGATYAELVAELRKVAGGAIRQAWLDAPCADDAGMNISNEVVDLSQLKPLEDTYLAAVVEYLKKLSMWWR